MKTKKLLLFSSVFFILIFWGSEITAQSLIDSNPSDINDFKSMINNPSVITFQNSQAILGMKVYHLGIIDNSSSGLKNSFLGLGISNIAGTDFGLGIVGMYYDTPMYNETHFGIEISRKFFSKMSLGLKFGFLMTSYDKDKFDLVDENDPVFENAISKTALNIGAGFLYNPFSKLFIGGSIDHLNRPNVSLIGDKVSKPLIANAGIKYNFGFISPCLGVTYYHEKALPNFYVESSAADWGLIRFGYANENLKIEGLLYLFKGINLNYVYEYPLSDLSGVTGGTHTVSFNFNVHGGPGLERWAEMEIAKREKSKVLSGIFVDSEVDTLDIIKKTVIRKISPEITNKEIASLPSKFLFHLDSTTARDSKVDNFKPVSITYLVLAEKQEQTQKYQAFMNSLSKALSKNKKLTVKIVATPKSVSRGLALKKYISKNSTISSDQIEIVTAIFKTKNEAIRSNRIISESTYISLSPSSNIFLIKILGAVKRVKNWELKIKNPDGKVVKTISGQGSIPSEVAWKWSKDIDSFTNSGHYSYQLFWSDIRNEKSQSQEWSFVVREIHRKVSIEVRKQTIDVNKTNQFYLYQNLTPNFSGALIIH